MKANVIKKDGKTFRQAPSEISEEELINLCKEGRLYLIEDSKD